MIDGDWRTDRIGAALRGANPTVLARLGSGFAVIGDTQFLPGYCVLLTDDPGVDRLTDLPRPRRLRFLADMDLLGEAVENVCRRLDPAFLRVNYQILGNKDHFLHAHVSARYAWEPDEYRQRPWTHYPAATREAPATMLGEQHDELRAALTAELTGNAGRNVGARA